MIKPIFFIAEISANHCGSIKMAKKLIKCAKKNGANAVKLQTFTADTMTVNSNKNYFKIKKGLWKNYNLWQLYKKAHTPYEWHKELFEYAKKIGITIFSTPFDETAVDLLIKLKCPIYKISSFEMTDFSLLKKIATTKKPIIISTGMANMKEIELTYNTAIKYGIKDITLLYCVSNYPSKNSDFNLNNIKIIKEKFNCRVGLSDHSKDNNVARAAVAAGAEVVEKHIALEGQSSGLDINFSLKGVEIQNFKSAIDETYNLLGDKKFTRNKSEDDSKLFRRSIFAIEQIKKGEKFTIQNIKRIRPSHGISPMYYEKIINKISPMNISKNEPITIKVLKKLNIKKII